MGELSVMHSTADVDKLIESLLSITFEGALITMVAVGVVFFSLVYHCLGIHYQRYASQRDLYICATEATNQSIHRVHRFC